METVLGAARRLAVDAAAARVITALREAGVRPLLLKGAAVTAWLYSGDDGARWYEDIDLLVSPAHLPACERTLPGLGFSRFIPADGVNREECSDMWIREHDNMNVDLHRCVVGAGADPAALWEALSADTGSIVLQGTSVETLGFPAMALHVVLHAAQHGIEGRKPLRDLERAVEQVDGPTWDAAARLAGRIDAGEAFAAGLRLTAAGGSLADRLGLPRTASTVTVLRASSAPHLALGIERVATAPGLRRKAAILLRKLVPEPSFMRAWSPLARRGPFGLAVAYVWRPLYLAKVSPGGLLAWSRARRAARRGPGGRAQ
jgi:hypothetical protein